MLRVTRMQCDVPWSWDQIPIPGGAKFHRTAVEQARPSTSAFAERHKTWMAGPRTSPGHASPTMTMGQGRGFIQGRRANGRCALAMTGPGRGHRAFRLRVIGTDSRPAGDPLAPTSKNTSGRESMLK